MRLGRLTVAGMLLLSGSVAMAQSIPVETRLGKVSVEECAMTTYPKDTSAKVVVLWENNDVHIDFNLSTGRPMLTQNHIERIKVLKDEGKDYADDYLLVSTDINAPEHASRIQVTTYNLENGKVVATKMPKSDIVRSEYSDKVIKVAFAAPNVKVGSVVEVSYQFETARYFVIPDFYFQRTVPVNLCEYKIAIPSWITVRKNSRGYENVSYESYSEHGVDLGSLLPANDLEIDSYRAVDLPAMKSEPMVYCTRQFRTAVAYDVTAFTFPGAYEDFSRSWGNVAEAITESEIFKRLNASCKFKEDIDAVKSEGADRVVDLVKLIQSKVQWNKEIDLLPDKAADILKTHSGTNSDINALAASAFKYAGYDVTPVLIRRRSDGMLQRYKPSLGSFSTFILKLVDKDGSVYHVDAADPSGYINVVYDDYLTDSGFAVHPDKTFEWVDLTGLCRNARSYLVSGIINPDGSVTGNLSCSNSNISSLDFKDDYIGYDKEEDYVEDLEKEMEIEIEDFQVSGIKDYSKNSSMKFNFTKESGESTPDVLFVNPFLLKFHSENLFREEERKLPVEFEYPEMITYTARFEVPEGFVVDQMPSPVKYVSDIPSTLQLRCGFDGKTVTVSYSFNNKAIMVLPDKYKDFRQYWAEICTVYKQMIVLKKAQ